MELNRYFAPIISVVDVLILFEQNVELHLIYQDKITFITNSCLLKSSLLIRM